MIRIIYSTIAYASVIRTRLTEVTVIGNSDNHFNYKSESPIKRNLLEYLPKLFFAMASPHHKSPCLLTCAGIRLKHTIFSLILLYHK